MKIYKFNLRILITIVTFSFSLNVNSQNATKGNNSGSSVDNTIDVGAPGIKRIRIAIPNFYISNKNLSLTLKDLNLYSGRLTSILDFTNWFEFIPKNAILSSTKDLSVQSFDYEQWLPIKAEYVVLGKINSGTLSGRYNFELRLFNVKTHEQILGKQYSNINHNLVDLVLRRFADQIVNTLTGSPGPFLSQLVFIGKKTAKENGQVYISDFDGSNIQQITSNSAVNMSPTWSKDGTKILFTSFASGRAEIYMYNLSTKKTFRMTTSTGNSSGANWSPTENLIAYSASTNNGETHIFTMNDFGGNKKEFIETSEIGVEPAFSPDGKQIAYTSAKFGKPMIFIKNLASSETTRLTYAGWYNASASWNPEGKAIAFASYDRNIDKWDLFKINTDGAGLERLTLNQGDNEKPTWSPDGRFILFQSDRSEKNNKHSIHKLYVMSKDASFQKPLDIPLHDVKQPSWGPRMNQFDEN